MLRIDHDRYVKSTRKTTSEGVTREPDEEVGADYVRRYLDARSFMEGLGGTEEHRRSGGGVLSVRATRPDGEEVRETIFTPTRKGNS